jgi:predicted HicB family RNase H-like nuclease
MRAEARNTTRRRMNKSKTVIIRVEPELHKQLVMEAAELGITLSEHIRQILITVPVLGAIKDGVIEWRRRE